MEPVSAAAAMLAWRKARYITPAWCSFINEVLKRAPGDRERVTGDLYNCFAYQINRKSFIGLFSRVEGRSEMTVTFKIVGQWD